MFNLIAIGDPIIDTHIQIASDCAECHVTTGHHAELCLDYGAKIPILDSFQDLGGNAPNVAVAAAKLGFTSAVVATIGADATGRLAVEELQKRGVATNYITIDAQAKTRYSIVLNYQAERTILSYSDKKNYQWPQPFPETDWIYYTGLSEGFEVIQDQLLKHLKKNPETRLAINPGSYMLKFGFKSLREIIRVCDLLIVNREEAERITGMSLEAAKNFPALIHSLNTLGAVSAVITDGPRGAYAGNASEVWFLPPFPVPTVAKTGAGDAFSAGFIAAIQAGHDIPHALQWGTANSASVIQFPGPHKGLLDQIGIKKMLKKFASIVPEQI